MKVAIVVSTGALTFEAERMDYCYQLKIRTFLTQKWSLMTKSHTEQFFQSWQNSNWNVIRLEMVSFNFGAPHILRHSKICGRLDTSIFKNFSNDARSRLCKVYFCVSATLLTSCCLIFYRKKERVVSLIAFRMV